jgi:hypothetical protein
MGEITVSRRGYKARRRKKEWKIRRDGKVITAHARKEEWTVRPATYERVDIGAPGRGPRKIPISDGQLRRFGYTLDKPEGERRAALRRAVEEYGPEKVWHRLQALINLREEAGIPGPKPRPEEKENWEKLRADRDWVKEAFNPDLTPRAAIEKWKSMSHEERARARARLKKI